MTSHIKTLGALLVLQLGLVFWGYSSSTELSSYIPNAPITNVTLADVNQVVVDGPEGKQVTLEEISGTWVIPSFFNFPASKNKLKELDEKLLSVKAPLPVAQTKVAEKQFSVSEKKFERKVVLKKGEDILDTVYVGTSPGFRKVHVRSSKNSLVYPIEFSAYSLPVTPKEWVQSDLFSTDIENVQKLTLGDVSLTRSGTTWEISDLAENEELVTAEVTALVGKSTRVNFLEVLGEKTKEAKTYTSLPEVLRYSLLLEGGEAPLDFELYGPLESPKEETSAQGEEEKPEAPKEYALVRSDLPFVVKVSDSFVSGLTQYDRSKLVQEKVVAVESDGGSVEEAGEEES